MEFKKVNTPLRLVGIQKYKSKDGQAWIKYPGGSRKPLKKNTVIWTKLLTILVILGVVGFAGYKIGFHYLSNKMMNEMADQILTTDEVEALKKDPDVQQIIADNSKYFDKKTVEALQGSVAADANNGGSKDHTAAGDKPVKSDSTTDKGGASKPATDKPATGDQLIVKNKDEAASLLLSKFSKKELTGLADKAKDGLTPEEKQSIKDTLLSRLSDEEFSSVKIIALMEIVKRDE
ncbi:tRNA (adenine(58)-N(1))-methyltransferase non-catalytic subunit TRM6 [Paenibacillus glycanilyticus]|uniref:tRNA (adenine(58)-N(1))-methyltransferase non-catalytic subunit TRM6 n=1 Tax=Paenibacillus glycanilyticus TaxID=126569 RepID=UPI00203C547A|nr:tRNA (adenine(58)-N(1))-methyltransferase non-catalytic subunit TRM6 [Paenibacillus glycanilyticus]MCM3630922.1 tRNA (adenine(58)-N(1))-methyltransferase non-catalytic subunit TRM6 [Paenibacillus glycanilyticus]